MNNNLIGDEVGKLFVGGLDWSTTQETLRNYFSQYGEVVDCVIMKDKTTNQSRGFGFVKFKDPNCVRTVLETKPHNLDGRNIDPKPCTPRGMQPEKSQTKEGWVEVKKAEPRDNKAPGHLGPGQWAPRSILSAANGWSAQPTQTWQQPYGPQGVWVATTGPPIGGYGPPISVARGTPTHPASPFSAFLVTTPAGSFAAPQGYPQQGFSAAPQFGYSFGTPQADQYIPQVPPPPTTPGTATLGFAPTTTPTQDLSKASAGQPEFSYSQYGYGQDLTAFSHTFADPNQPTAYGTPTAQPANAPQPAASLFGRGQNHNVQGFHPYRR
ncbi:DAZ-associated protein 1 isoform X6 [Entelurus aequoreus]|uniref:DAZ-associated protein 1 isoform X6 n=1 Tax=Entelurus aequoreus TaxID=161455 RepID=UPI002B1DDF04|nr:DAZ-associated protein 1 isoform X6 [Entelurus aequoreus]